LARRDRSFISHAAWGICAWLRLRFCVGMKVRTGVVLARTETEFGTQLDNDRFCRLLRLPESLSRLEHHWEVSSSHLVCTINET
jgi:hypothetical protein